MNNKPIIFGIIIIFLVVGLSGCNESEVAIDSGTERELEPEPEYQDFTFLAWIQEDASATVYYTNKILDEWKKDYDDVSFYDLKNYAEERQDIIEQSQYEVNQFILSFECDNIRDEWYAYLEDAWMNDNYLITASDCMIGYPKDYDCYSTNIDFCEIYTERASAHVRQAHKMIDELD